MKASPKIPHIPDEERTPLVIALLEIIQFQQEQIQELKAEIARLKGGKPRPKIKPSLLEKNPERSRSVGSGSKRPGSDKRSKTESLPIHDTRILKPENIPHGSIFKGFEDYTVQGLVFRCHNTLYRRERWECPDGSTITAPLPPGVKALGGHFDSTLRCFIIYQYHHCHVTQPLILEQLREVGVDISSGQVNRIITEGKESFHREKAEILRVGLEVSGYIHADDTSARHQGKNWHCTHIGNELFAWFFTSAHKSRANFLGLLHAGTTAYALNTVAIEHMRICGLARSHIESLTACGDIIFPTEAEWKSALDSLHITGDRNTRIATEGALLGSLSEQGCINPSLVVLSDDAGQFDVLLHALCWIHAERAIKKLIGFDESQRKALEAVRSLIWDFYAALKAYKQRPTPEKKEELEKRFDEIFTMRTCYETLNRALRRIHKNKAELLLVLSRPDVPLHNNLSERDIREQAKRRHISGSTRSDEGRRCRDTFPSLKKTCRKLKIGFWDYLLDRLSGLNLIPWLPDLIRLRALESPG